MDNIQTCNCTQETFFYKIKVSEDNYYTIDELIDLPDVYFLSWSAEVPDFMSHPKTKDMHETLIELAEEQAIYLEDDTLTLKEERNLLYQKLKDSHYILPVYAYIHSGVTISTSPFNCSWDSGQIGWIYVDKVNAKKHEYTEETLIDFVRTYDLYLTEGIYLYSVQLWKRYADGYSRFVETVDSCTGFLGNDIYENGMLDSINFEIYAIDKDAFIKSLLYGRYICA